MVSQNDINDEARPPNQAQISPVPNPVPSYWLRTPHKYASLRSTPALPERCDIAIVGSGMAGILTAYYLLKEQYPSSLPSIVVLEARELCSGATARNGGHVKVKTATLAGLHDGEGKRRDELQSYVFGVIAALKKIVDEEGVDCEFELRRSFDVFCHGVEERRVKAVYDEALRKGEEWAKHVSYVDNRYVEQVTSIQGAKGAFSVPAASFSPYLFVTQVLERLLKKHPDKVNVQTNTPVTSITENKHGGTLLETPRGTLIASKVVLATNAYTAGLLPSFKHTVVPVRAMASHHVPQTPVHPHLNHTYNIHFAPTTHGPTGVDYLNPRPDGGIVVGGGAWFFKDERASWYNNFDDSSRFPARVEAHWFDYMQRNFRGWEQSNAQADSVWVGIIGTTSDGMPHVGRVPMARNMWVLVGFNGGGMALIATAAKAVASMVREDKGFEDVKGEFGLPGGFGTSEERLKEAVERT